MRRFAFSASVLLALAACGPSGAGHGTSGGSAADNAACALLGDGQAMFGPGAQHFGYAGIDTMAGTCEFTSADGKRGGDVILYTAQSLGGVTPSAQMQTILTAWAGANSGPLNSIDGLGDEAKAAANLPGYQTQIAFRKGGDLVLIAGRSGDDAMTGEQLARRMAAAAAASLAAPAH
jgi:hypothetical protein